jgi:hypothetical protein
VAKQSLTPAKPEKSFVAEALAAARRSPERKQSRGLGTSGARSQCVGDAGAGCRDLRFALSLLEPRPELGDWPWPVFGQIEKPSWCDLSYYVLDLAGLVANAPRDRHLDLKLVFCPWVEP